MKRIDTKKLRVRTTLGLLACAAMLVPQLSSSMSIDVSPVRIEIKVQPGETQISAVSVQNTGHEPVRLRAYVEDWGLSEEGTPIFLPAGTGPRSATNWIEWAPGDFLLEPNEVESVRFSVRVPDRIPTGGYRGSLLLESLPLDRSEQDRKQVHIRGRVACMVYVSVGDPRREARIAAMTTVTRDDRIFLQLKVRNTGEDHIRLAGELTLSNGGIQVGQPIQLPDVPVLPGDLRMLEFELPPEDLTEPMTAAVTVVVPGAGRLVGECSIAPQRADLLTRP